VNGVLCEPLVAVPVIVTVYVPAGVEFDVVIVNDDDEPAVMLDGEKDADAPDGSPLALSETVWAEPDVTAVEAVAPAFCPAVTLADVGLTAIEKSFEVAVLTVSVNVVVCVADAPVPAIVTVYVPVGVVLDVLSVSVDDEPAVTVEGVNDAVAPLGRPLALSDTD
jgi:hypothetical protein